jgi:hypothetical protein
MSAWGRKYWQINKKKLNAYQRTYHALNQDKSRAWGREGTRRYRKKYPRRFREKNWKRLGMDLKYADFAKRFEEQGGKCAVCKKDLILGSKAEAGTKQACADHDHHTGKFRGVLCYGCNNGVVNGLERDRSLVISAIEYLSRQGDGSVCGEFVYQRTSMPRSYLAHIG